MRSDRLTDRQAVVLLTLGLRFPGQLSTNEIRDLAARAGANDDAFPELPRALTGAQIIAVGRQLVSKGLATEEGYLNTARYWKLTANGNDRIHSLRGEI